MLFILNCLLVQLIILCFVQKGMMSQNPTKKICPWASMITIKLATLNHRCVITAQYVCCNLPITNSLIFFTWKKVCCEVLIAET